MRRARKGRVSSHSESSQRSAGPFMCRSPAALVQTAGIPQSVRGRRRRRRASSRASWRMRRAKTRRAGIPACSACSVSLARRVQVQRASRPMSASRATSRPRYGPQRQAAAPGSTGRPRPQAALARGAGSRCRSEFTGNPPVTVGESPSLALEFARRTLEFARTAGKVRQHASSIFLWFGIGRRTCTFRFGARGSAC